jgi:hypothetical protein
MLIGSFELSWVAGHAATAYTVEGAVIPGHWEELGTATDLAADRSPSVDTVSDSYGVYRAVY